MIRLIRQGDVLLIECKKMPDNVEPIKPINGKLVLAEGEATGHSHTVDAECATLFGVDEKMVMVVDAPTTIEHQEHGAIEIAPGQYWVVRQREYTPKEIVRVRD
jgi:hypothetical protein